MSTLAPYIVMVLILRRKNVIAKLTCIRNIF